MFIEISQYQDASLWLAVEDLADEIGHQARLLGSLILAVPRRRLNIAKDIKVPCGT